MTVNDAMWEETCAHLLTVIEGRREHSLLDSRLSLPKTEIACEDYHLNAKTQFVKQRNRGIQRRVLRQFPSIFFHVFKLR